ncbi:hypothetical protein CC2G_002565 [Coprinopsis cinerea AmutBmut pab1-1]|nr:hypothetical protein CC2G_002565 [Coprinopsis cinerea AmutBmut pab1-1]
MGLKGDHSLEDLEQRRGIPEQGCLYCERMEVGWLEHATAVDWSKQEMSQSEKRILEYLALALEGEREA